MHRLAALIGGQHDGREIEATVVRSAPVGRPRQSSLRRLRPPVIRMTLQQAEQPFRALKDAIQRRTGGIAPRQRVSQGLQHMTCVSDIHVPTRAPQGKRSAESKTTIGHVLGCKTARLTELLGGQVFHHPRDGLGIAGVA